MVCLHVKGRFKPSLLWYYWSILCLWNIWGLVVCKCHLEACLGGLVVVSVECSLPADEPLGCIDVSSYLPDRQHPCALCSCRVCTQPWQKELEVIQTGLLHQASSASKHHRYYSQTTVWGQILPMIFYVAKQLKRKLKDGIMTCDNYVKFMYQCPFGEGFRPTWSHNKHTETWLFAILFGL